MTLTQKLLAIAAIDHVDTPADKRDTARLQASSSEDAALS